MSTAIVNRKAADVTVHRLQRGDEVSRILIGQKVFYSDSSAGSWRRPRSDTSRFLWNVWKESPVSGVQLYVFPRLQDRSAHNAAPFCFLFTNEYDFIE